MNPLTKPTSYVNRTSLIMFLVILIGVLALCFWMVAPYILSVLMGGILALLASPLYRRLRQDEVSPKAASLLITIALVLLVLGPLALLAIMAINQGIAIGSAVSNFQGLSFRDIIDRLSQWGPVETVIGNPEALENQVRNGLQTLGRTATGVILSIVANIPEIALQLFIAVLTCFFLLMDGKKFLVWLQDKIPLDEEVRTKIVTSFQNTTVSVIWATLAAAGAQAACMIVGFFSLGIPGAILAGGVTFIFAWIPILGSTPVWMAGAVYLYAQGAIIKMIVMIVIGIFTGVIDNIVRPLVLSGRDETHPLVSLIAIFGGIQLFGIFGVFVGPIIVAILLTMLEIWPTIGQRARLMSATSTHIVINPHEVPEGNVPPPTTDTPQPE